MRTVFYDGKEKREKIDISFFYAGKGKKRKKKKEMNIDTLFFIKFDSSYELVGYLNDSKCFSYELSQPLEPSRIIKFLKDIKEKNKGSLESEDFHLFYDNMELTLTTSKLLITIKSKDIPSLISSFKIFL
jgi:hypothetical protein